MENGVWYVWGTKGKEVETYYAFRSFTWNHLNVCVILGNMNHCVCVEEHKKNDSRNSVELGNAD